MRLLTTIALVLVGVMLASPAHAGSYPDLATEILDKMSNWNAELIQASGKALNSVQVVLFVKSQMLVMAVIATLLFLYNWGTNRASLADGIGLAVRMLLVSVALLSYPTLTATLSDLGTGIGGLMQQAMLGDDDPFYPLFRVMSATENVQFPEFDSMWALNASKLLGLVLAYLGVMVLIIVVALVTVWAFWGYTLMKLVGIFFLPFLLVPKTAAWFDNWLAIFLGFIAFEMLARIGVSMTTLAIYIALGIPPFGEPYEVTIDIMNFWSAIPLTLFVAINVYGLFRLVGLSSGLFSSGIGVSQALGNVSGMVSKALK